MNIGQTIREIRIRRKQNLVDFAKQLGVSHAAVSRYENGLVTPSRAVVLLLLQVAEGEKEKDALFTYLKVPKDGRALVWASSHITREYQDHAGKMGARHLEETKQAESWMKIAETIADMGPPGALIRIANLWIQHGKERKALKAFENAESYLKVELASLRKRVGGVHGGNS